MKHITLLLLFLSLGAKAQTRDSLFGKWVFESVAEDMNLSKEMEGKGFGLFEKFTLVFFPDNFYESQLLNHAEKGTWSLSGNKITNALSDGATSATIEILAFEPNRMKIKVQSLILYMKRTERFSNPQNLMHKWLFEGTRLDPEDEDLNPAPTNNYIDIRPDNTYTVVMGPITETGLWYFDATQNAILATVHNTIKQWKIVTLDGHTLELNMGASTTGYVFRQ